MDQDLKLIALHDKLYKKIEELKAELATVEKQIGPQGEMGPQGPKGEQGERGRDGVDGKDGRDGVDGKDGRDGTDGTSITDVDVDFDNHLRVSLSDGSVIDAGEINAVIAEDAVTKIIGMGGGGGSGNGGIKYTEVTTTSYTVQESDLIVGHNLYGVDSGGNTVVYLPVITDPTNFHF